METNTHNKMAARSPSGSAGFLRFSCESCVKSNSTTKQKREKIIFGLRIGSNHSGSKDEERIKQNCTRCAALIILCVSMHRCESHTIGMGVLLFTPTPVASCLVGHPAKNLDLPPHLAARNCVFQRFYARNDYVKARERESETR